MQQGNCHEDDDERIHNGHGTISIKRKRSLTKRSNNYLISFIGSCFILQYGTVNAHLISSSHSSRVLRNINPFAYNPPPHRERTALHLIGNDRDNNHFMFSQEGFPLKSTNTNINNEPSPSLPEENSLLPFTSFITSYVFSPMREVQLGALVFLSSFIVALNTLPNLSPEIFSFNNQVEDILTVIFAIEFLLRWYAKGQLGFRFLTKPLSLVDIIVVIIPLLIESVPYVGTIVPALSSGTGLLNLRLLRVLRLQRVLVDMDTFGKFVQALGLQPSLDQVRPYHLQLARVVLSVFTLASVSTGLIYMAEHEVNPNIPDYFTALYFGLTTLTTVGFGDITPITVQGKMVVSGSILVGVVVVPAQAAMFFDALLEYQAEREVRRKQQEEEKKKEKEKENANTVKICESKICYKCGVKDHNVDANFCWSCGFELDCDCYVEKDVRDLTDMEKKFSEKSYMGVGK